ncbi:hypothetical protein LP420_04525 [Massilia sp. B-10]|nr:hypothetical protein LP420_04525 [Massilia sp. B-10]
MDLQIPPAVLPAVPADTVLPAAKRDLAPLLLVPVLMLAMLPLVGSFPTWVTLTIALPWPWA